MTIIPVPLRVYRRGEKRLGITEQPCGLGGENTGWGFRRSAFYSWGKSFHLSVPQFPHLLNGDNDTELPHSQLVTKELGEPQVKGKEEGKGLVIRAPVNAPPSKPSWSVPKGSPLLLAQGLIAMG